MSYMYKFKHDKYYRESIRWILMCAFPRETSYTHIYLTQIEKQKQTKTMIPPKSNLANR